MTPRETLASQIGTLRMEVRGERAALEPQLRLITGGALKRIVAAEIISQLSNRLNARAEKLTVMLESLHAGSKVAVARRQYRNLEKECRDLFGECLTVLTTEAIRALQLDSGISEIVERLLVCISSAVSVPWSHLTALADGEFLATASQIIRLRYPVSSIWDIPVAVHEFGHFIGPRWPADQVGTPTPYQVFLSVTNLGPESYLGEYFADMFATFIMGPSYVATCLKRRFDPASEPSATISATHPSDGERAEWILICLELLQEFVQRELPDSNTDLFLREISARERADWKAAVYENEGKELDDKTVARLRVRARELWKCLMEWAGTAACLNLQPTLTLRAAFVHDSRGAQAIPQAKLRDIMNAAWLLRMESGSDAARIVEIERWAKTLLTRAEL